jgi:predicted enzyme related to lactoylglutathione lyase
MAGQLVHFEVQAEDADRASTFYENVFGWDFQASGMPGIDYRVVRTGESQGGGLYQSDDRKGHLIVYFDTDDIDATIAKVRESGGDAGDKQPIPGVGWFAPVTDTEGNSFSLFQSDESASPPGQ